MNELIDHIETDLEEDMERTLSEIAKAMNYVSYDLSFTTEREKDFAN